MFPDQLDKPGTGIRQPPIMHRYGGNNVKPVTVPAAGTAIGPNQAVKGWRNTIFSSRSAPVEMISIGVSTTSSILCR